MKKSCKDFCEKDFLVERENVEELFSNEQKPSMKYVRIKELRKTNKQLAKVLKNMYLSSCNQIYCQNKCTTNKKWLKSFTKKRKTDLIKRGAKSGCRDLMKEFPKYYKNV